MKARNSKARYCTSRLCGIPKYLLWAVLGLAVIVIVVPIAVMFGRKKPSTPKGTVLVPLYVYPSPGAWDPLLIAHATNTLHHDFKLTTTRITNHPRLNFTVVVNPASGPGLEPTPDSNYTREIPKLNQHANVRTVGYVSTSYTNRNISLALRDIETYSAWSENSTIAGLGLQGIFLDETPSQYQATSAKFLDTLADSITSQTGLGTDPLIIHNPGTIPDPRYMRSANLTVVFEGAYSTYRSHGFHKTMTAFQDSAHAGRDALACIVHSLPSTLDGHALTKDLRSSCGSAFITGLSKDYYASFWPGWLGFTDEMAA
ncbi:Spherulin [Lachnellula occidentalis]|uniref:Spherulin n=1 Tax=Lachnellula occidentalis TaxID=215460 RepID=A0A8H8S6R3_9HELO|nr:Spherulin [Lachnellula occidentalis]